MKDGWVSCGAGPLVPEVQTHLPDPGLSHLFHFEAGAGAHGLFSPSLVALLEFITYPHCLGVFVDASLSDPILIAFLKQRIEAEGKWLALSDGWTVREFSDQEMDHYVSEYELARDRFQGVYSEPGNDEPEAIVITLFENTCFAKCRFCPQFRSPELIAEQHIDNKLFHKIVHDLPMDKPVTVRLGTGGEPLDYERIFALIAFLKRHRPNAYVEMATNGILLDERRAVLLLEAGLDHLSVSVNAPTREHYRWFAGVDGFSRIVENLVCLLDLRHGYSMRVSANLLAIERWKEELPMAARQLAPLVDEVIYSHVQFVNDPALKNLPQYNPPLLPIVPTCTFLHKVLTIDTQGDVQVCCATAFSDAPAPMLGNVGDQHYLDIWRSDDYQQLREKNLRGLPVLDDCTSCVVDQPSFVEDLLRKRSLRLQTPG